MDNQYITVKLWGVFMHQCHNFNGGLDNSPFKLGMDDSSYMSYKTIDVNIYPCPNIESI